VITGIVRGNEKIKWRIRRERRIRVCGRRKERINT
jgi:hypothetical protein